MNPPPPPPPDDCSARRAGPDETARRTGRDTTGAITEGLTRTTRVITAAAAIMVAVFGAFALSDQVFLKPIGIGVASAIFVDTTIVRTVLVRP